MADQPSNNNYSFEDIQRYISGKMSSSEMHAIEKAALQDNFLADAIEGFKEIDASAASQHINQINASLHKEDKNILPLSLRRKSGWWRIAAIVVLIFGIGVLSDYVFKKMNSRQQIAQVKMIDTNALKAFDSITPVTDSEKIPADVEANNQNITLLKPRADASSKTKNKSANNDVVINNDEASTITQAAPAYKNEARSFSKMAAPEPDSMQTALQGKVAGVQLNQGTINGTVVDDKNQPVAYATISEDSSKKAVTADVNGDFNIQLNDTNSLVTASEPGYESKKTRLQPNAENKIVLNQLNSNLEEVVVVGYGAKKQKASKAASPVGGWNSFNNYVTEELGKDSLFKKSNANFVELEFLIDDDGNPYNFKITRPLDDKSNRKAQDIISAGPKWTTTSKQKKAKVKINF